MATLETSVSPRTPLPATAPGFAGTLMSEWTKLRSIRSTKILVGLALVLSIGMTGLMSLIIGSTFDEWSPNQQVSFDPITFSFFGSLFSAILISVLGVMAITNEYSSGMIRLTLTATPQRGRVLMAKVAAISLLTLVVGTISTLGMFLVGQMIFSSYGMESSSLADGGALRAVVTVSLLSPVYPVVGMALAIAMRSTAGAITTVLGLIFVPSIFGGLLPVWWQENVLAFVLGPVTDSISIQHLAPDASNLYLSFWVALVALAVWLGASIGGAYLLLTKRDA